MSLLTIDSKSGLEQIASGAYNSNTREIGRRAFLIGTGAYVLSACGKGGSSPTSPSSIDLVAEINPREAQEIMNEHQSVQAGRRSLNRISIYDPTVPVWVQNADEAAVRRVLNKLGSSLGKNFAYVGGIQDRTLIIGGNGHVPPGAAGVTEPREFYNDNSIKLFMISFTPGFERNEGTIEHEVLHALGYFTHPPRVTPWLRTLNSLPHGSSVQPDGKVYRL